MTYSTTVAALAASAVALASAAAAAGVPASLPLVGNCNVQTAQLGQGANANWLGMYCNNLNTANFAYNWTWINLDWCLANRAGHLQGRKDGHYHATCTRCSTHLGPAANKNAKLAAQGKFNDGHTLNLQCACLDARGRGVSTTIDLNNVLADVDGALGCYGHLGNKTVFGPPPSH